MESWIVSNVSLTHISSFNQTSDCRCTLTSKTAWSVTLWELSEGFGPVYFLENPTDDQTDSPFKDAPALKYPLFCGLWISSTSQRFSSRFGLKLRASESGRDLNGGVHLEIRHTEDHLKTVKLSVGKITTLNRLTVGGIGVPSLNCQRPGPGRRATVPLVPGGRDNSGWAHLGLTNW